MTAPASTRLHADAIVATLTAAGLAAHLGEAQPSGGLPAVPPYVVVHVSGGMTGGMTGTMGDPYRDLEVAFQTTAVGTTAEQALWMHDKTITALLGATPAVSGRSSQPIWLDEPPQPVRRDDAEAAEPLFYAVARWMFRTSV